MPSISGPFDHVQRPRALEPRFLGVRHDVLVDAVHQCVGQTLVHRPVAPGQVRHPLHAGLALEAGGYLQQSLGGVAAAREYHIEHALAQFRLDILVKRQLSGVDDAHAHAGADRVVEKHRMHRLAHRIIAAKREGHVADATADQRVRAGGANPAYRLDEIERIAVVGLDASGDRKNVRIEDNVFGRKPGHFGEQAVAALADPDLAIDRVRLALLVKGHHHDGGAVSAHLARLLEELRLALLETD